MRIIPRNHPIRIVQHVRLCCLLFVTMCAVRTVVADDAAAAATSAGDDFRVSLSVSPFTELLTRGGISFTDGQTTANTAEQLQRMFQTHGANEVYARISTTREFMPGNGDHSVNRGLKRAALAKTLGVPFNPEIGLWKQYGDITHQPPPDFTDYPQLQVPGEWTSLTIEQMLPILREYGELVAREILDTGVEVRIWDLGNEVEYGVAGVAVRLNEELGQKHNYQSPDNVDPEIGKMTGVELMQMPPEESIAWLEAHLWPHVGQIFAAVAEGIRKADPSARFSTHTSGGGAVRTAQSVAFYKTLRDNGFLPDELGFSFYPTSRAGSLEAFKNTATAVHEELDRPVFIAEFGYPSGTMIGAFAWNIPEENYPLTPAGQADFTRDLVAWGRETGLLSGIRPWAPDFTMPGWEPMSFFTLTGKTATAKPALSAIQEGLQAGSR